MTSRCKRWFGVTVGIVSIGWISGLCFAQQEKPTVDQILQVWKKRQEKVAAARFEMSFEETIPKGVYSFGLPHEKWSRG
jgi:hypothetical protein